MKKDDLWRLFPIILKPHNPEYINWYRQEKKILTKIIGDHLIKRMSHIGSTSVHNLIAKPTIDILLEVENEVALIEIKNKLEKESYICHKQKDMFKNNSLMCLKGYSEKGFEEKVFHIHIKVLNNHKELYFRDYLKEHPEIARAYGELKLELMKKYKHHRDHYTDSKSDFINRYTEAAKNMYKDRYNIKKKQ
ncbi:GrpB family protein [Mycoplasmatota bacterium]|nr:GrpB family protein [Mycoplasmatota bacterium]